MQFTQSCIDQIKDPQIKNLCEGVISEYKGAITTLKGHINSAQVQ